MIPIHRRSLLSLLNLCLVFSTSFMAWTGLCAVSNTPSPITAVLSGSMEPAFQRGDILILWNRRQDIQIGEVVVYNVPGKDIPIVHRVIKRFGGGSDGQPLKLLTKGDNNPVDDVGLYPPGQEYLDRERDVVGTVVGYIPYLGYGKIILADYKWVKIGALGLMGLMAILQRE